jgi:prolyl oligopeptidase
VLIRIDVKAGHGAGKSLAATIQENVDIQAFTLYNMGFKDYQKLNNLDFI